MSIRALASDIVLDLTSGKGQFRLIVQPVLASIIGARLGVSDAREGRMPFINRLRTEAGAGHLFKESLVDLIFPLCAAMVIDMIVQHYTLGFVRPLGAVVVGALLVWLPYSIARALANRIARHFQREHHHDVKT